jgi:hypothetical protein
MESSFVRFHVHYVKELIFDRMVDRFSHDAFHCVNGLIDYISFSIAHPHELAYLLSASFS